MEQIAAGVKAYQDSGVTHFLFALNTGDIDRIGELMRNIAEQVIPQFR